MPAVKPLSFVVSIMSFVAEKNPVKSTLLRLIVLCCLVAGVAFSLPAIVMAQTNSAATLYPGAADGISAARVALNRATAGFEEIRKPDTLVRYDDSRLVKLQQQLEDLDAAMDKINRDLLPRLENLKTREANLGTPPAEGAVAEPQVLADERSALASESAIINAYLGEADAIASEASKLAQTISEYRRELFRQTLLGRVDLSRGDIDTVRKAFVLELADINSRVANWIGFTWQYKRSALLSALFLSFLLGILFFVGTYRLFSRFMHYDRNEEHPTQFSKHTLAFWWTFLPTISLLIFCLFVTFFLNNFGVMRADIALLLSAFLQFVVILFFAGRLATAVLQPSAPNWRLVPVTNSGARVLWWLIMAMALVNAADYQAGSISDVLDSPLILSVAKSLVATVIIGVIFLVLSFGRPLIANGVSDGGNGSPDNSEPAGARAWPRSIRIPLLVLGTAFIVLPFFGYVGLGRFAATQVIVLGGLLVAMYIGFLSAQAVSEPSAFAGSRMGQFLSQRFGFGAVVIEQFGLLAGLCIYLFVIVFGVPVVFLVWGYQPRDIQNWFANTFSEITIGSVTISLSGILLGIVLFVVGYFVTRWFQRWLDENIMQRGRLEDGLRNSIRIGIGYVGIAIAAVIGASVAGLNLSNLALVAGALSLGIGFGLQNIVNNFVSGLILLAERPFKVGDWVVTGSTQGFVRHISVRATEIETFQRQSVIVPNSEFINTPVGNWTHSNTLGRTEIAVGVSYDSDPRQVISILEEIGATNESVLHNPAPTVVFTGFGASSLDFELRVFVSDVLSGVVVGSDLRLQIFERFKKEGIEIPFPQSDVHLKLPDDGNETMVQAAKQRMQSKARSDKSLTDTEFSANDVEPDD